MPRIPNPFKRRATPSDAAPEASDAERPRWRRTASITGSAIAVTFVALGLLGWYWSWEPPRSGVNMPGDGPDVTGHATVDTLIGVTRWMLDKPGGYLSNDVLPPGVWLDNMPSFEFGVVIQCRDLARVLRNDYSRSQSQSTEDPALAEAEPALNFSSDSWIFPATESRYRYAIEHLVDYRERLVDSAAGEARFFARADNLREWLAVVERRLGDLSQQLSASVGQARFDMSLAGSPSGRASQPGAEEELVQTSWLEIDDVFYEARGSAWALLQFLRAARVDFETVLADKNAEVSLRQIIRELEAALTPLGSPIVLNGNGYGLFANHSLVLASYLSRAHAAVIDLRELLEQG